MEPVLIAVIASIPPTIAAIAAWVIGVRNSQQAEEARIAAALAASESRKAAVAAADSQREIIATKDGIYEVGKQIDGRLSELLELTRKSAFAAGKLEGRAEQTDQDAKKKA